MHKIASVRLLRLFATTLLVAVALYVPCAEPAVHASKKGLQVQMIDDALALGVRHAAINVNLVQLGAPSPAPGGPLLILDDQKYEFNPRYVKALEASINPLRTNGVIVYLIILVYDTNDAALARAYLHPNFDKACPFHVAAFNTVDADGERRFRACVTFLAQHFATADGPPVHFIVGNEVNSHWYWHNMGLAPLETVAQAYERTLRACHTAAAAVSARSRVFISLDHFWNASMAPKEPNKFVSGRSFLETFARIARRRGDFEWHVAYHPYPENLFDCRWWNDKTATMELTTTRITFKNIELLPEILKRPEFTFHGQARRIILSEQGFHSTNKPDGETLQAAAYAYAYRKVDRIDGIDAFILHRHVDHAQEGGLHLGLWTSKNVCEPVKRKLIYDVFRAADAPEWEAAFKFALPVIGLKDWNELK